jgi:hypothetical protein
MVVALRLGITVNVLGLTVLNDGFAVELTDDQHRAQPAPFAAVSARSGALASSSTLRAACSPTRRRLRPASPSRCVPTLAMRGSRGLARYAGTRDRGCAEGGRRANSKDCCARRAGISRRAIAAYRRRPELHLSARGSITNLGVLLAETSRRRHSRRSRRGAATTRLAEPWLAGGYMLFARGRCGKRVRSKRR